MGINTISAVVCFNSYARDTESSTCVFARRSLRAPDRETRLSRPRGGTPYCCLLPDTFIARPRMRVRFQDMLMQVA